VGRVIEGRDMRLIFVFAAALMLLAWFLAMRTLRKTEGVAGALHNRWVDLGRLLRSQRLLIFILMVAALKVGTAATFTFFSIYMDELGASRQLIGLAYGIQGLSELPLFLVATPLIRRLGPTRVLVVAFVLLSVRPLLYSVVSQLVLAVAAQVLHGSLSLFLVASVEYVNRLVPSAWRATGQSLFWAANMGIGAILGNTVSGYLYDQVGVQRMYGLSGLFILTVAVAAWLVLRGPDGTGAPNAA
jgi:PPP family 3-phenylpropionic acid transporter